MLSLTQGLGEKISHGQTFPVKHSSHYHAYGQAVRSELQVMEFGCAPAWSGSPEVEVILESPRPAAAHLASKSYHFEVNRERGLLYFQGVGTYLLEQGRRITVSPDPKADQRLLQRYLAGTVFAVLLHQQGRLVVHAASVGLSDGRAVLIAGESGAGKSSLAAALWQRGHTLLADDVSALVIEDDQPLSVLPAYPLVKVGPQVARRLALDSERLIPVQPGEDEWYLPCHEEPLSSQWPVACLFLLALDDENGCQQLSRRETVIEAVRHTIPTRLLHATGDAVHFRQCGALAATVPAYRLKHSNHLDSLFWLVDQVEDLASP